MARVAKPRGRTNALEQGRAAHAQKAWKRAYEQLSTADRKSTLGAEDLELLAESAYLTGLDTESLATLERAHYAHLIAGDAANAARCAFWIGFRLMLGGEVARGGGWLGRVRRMLDDAGKESALHGYIILPMAMRCVAEEGADAAYAAFSEAAEIGERFGDADLVLLARHGQGRALIRLGRVTDGMALLDEVMVAVTSGEVSPLIAGNVYCSVLDACQETFDLPRAHEWTAALARWCESQPDLVAHRGECLVHRAEILQLHGEWPSALDEASRACEWLVGPPPQPATGAAFYRQGELHRMRGERALAVDAYRQASDWGRRPQPGLALLRMAEGKTDTAAAAARQLLDEVTDRRSRSRMLGACVEILLAAHDPSAARAAAEELSRIDAEIGAPYLHALAAHAMGAVLMAEGKPRKAIAALRDAWTIWRDVDAPYEGARSRVLIGLAHRELGDDDTARFELGAARRVFEELGAAPDLARLAELMRRGERAVASPLTSREAQVLRLVATGKTNRAIAASLAISEKTVARHVSNIFSKLELSTRAAATAYAYEHGMLARST